MSEFTPIERMTFGNDGSVRVEMGYTHDMLDKMAALLSQEVDEELMKRIAPQFGYVKERTCHMELIDICGIWRCSECGAHVMVMAIGDGLGVAPNYCPNCGAKAVKK